MAKVKQQTTAAQRREQTRQQRQQRIGADQQTTRPVKSRKSKSKENNPWLLVGGILLMVVVVIGIFFWMANQQQTYTTQGANEAFNTLTHLDPKLLDQVGDGGVKNLMHGLPANATIPPGPNGKPQFLFVGAEYCPFCAAQRWAAIAALSRFGSFSQLDPLSTSEWSIPTYSFYKGHYSSQYIDFVSVEMQDNSSQKNPLEQLTPQETQLMTTYDAPPYTDPNSQGSIPFILIGNQHTSTGAYYNPNLLSGLSYQDIASRLKDPKSDVAKNILGSANYLTAAICQITQNQPANVCTTGAIPQLEQALPKPTALRSAGPQVALASGDVAMVLREQE